MEIRLTHDLWVPLQRLFHIPGGGDLREYLLRTDLEVIEKSTVKTSGSVKRRSKSTEKRRVNASKNTENFAETSKNDR